MEIRYVEWVDSSSQFGWTTLKELRQLTTDHCTSVGFVLAETDAHLTLICGYTDRKDDDGNVGDGSICIPKVAITKMRTLRKAK